MICTEVKMKMELMKRSEAPRVPLILIRQEQERPIITRCGPKMGTKYRIKYVITAQPA